MQPWNNQQHTDPYGPEVSGAQFQPHVFMNQFQQSPEAQDYKNIGGLAATTGVQSIRGGEAQATDEMRQSAGSQGLGRGFAQQQATDIRQQGTMGTPDTLMQANLEQRSRRLEMTQLMTQSLIEAHKYRAYYYLARKTLKYAKKAGDSSMWGGIIGGIGAIAGGAIAACWIAEAIFGKHDINTHLARYWVTNHAPRWLYWSYRAVGRQLAPIVASSETLKGLLRPLFLKFAEWGADAALQEQANASRI